MSQNLKMLGLSMGHALDGAVSQKNTLVHEDAEHSLDVLDQMHA